MIIWGWRTREIIQGAGEFHCPQCRARCEYHDIRLATYFTLYFIPLFETDYHGDVIKCLNCRLQFHPEVLERKPAAAQRKKKRKHRLQ